MKREKITDIPAQEPDNDTKPEKKRAKKKTKTIVPIICIILALAIGLGGGFLAVFLTGPRSSISYSQTDGKFKTPFGSEQFVFPIDYSFPTNYSALADKIIAGNLCVAPNIDPMPYSFQSFDYNAQWPKKKADSNFQVRLQSLMPVVYLTETFKDTGDERYLDCAQNFIVLWSEYSDGDAPEKNKYVWNGKIPAVRTANLIEFFITANEAGKLSKDMGELLIDMIYEHGKFLAEDVNFSLNTLGIHQAASLSFAAEFLDCAKSKSWEQTAEERLNKLYDGMYNSEGVENENTLAVHKTNTDLFYTAAKFMSNMGIDTGVQMCEKLDNAMKFSAYSLKPNGGIAEIGDTASTVVNGDIKNAAFYRRYSSDILTYSAMQGTEGTKPDSNSLLLPESGYYFSRSSWDADNFGQATWLMFKSGYQKDTSKHADDNSFMLYSKGYDIFVDTGFYSKEEKNAFRKHLTSALGHNTVIVDGQSYQVSNDSASLTGITDHSSEKGYEYVAGKNDSYPSVKYTRSVYNMNDAIIIKDSLRSDKEHKYSQIFNLSENMYVLEKGDSVSKFRINKTDYTVTIKQLGDPVKFNMIVGDGKNAGFGHLSRAANKLTKIKTLKYDIDAANADIITLITIEDGSGNIADISSIEYNAENGTFTVTPNGADAFSIAMK